MKAIIYTKYEPPEVFQIKAAEKPCPKSNEVLIRVRAVSVNYGGKVVSARAPRLSSPKQKIKM
jgi:NADPH:quinone reductase-like Zn-dependent oxidoreductase